MDPSKNREMMAKQAAGMVVVMVSVVVSRIKRSRPKPDPLLYELTDAEQHRQQTLQVIYNSTDAEYISMLRMRRAPFFSLCNLFRTRALVPETTGCTVEEQIAMLLHVVGHNQRFRVVHQSFRRSIETVNRHFH
jgi:hypothetical protein